MNKLISYLPYMLITTFTPGPNNLMSLYIVSHNGWRRGARVIFGIGLGFSTVMLLTIFFCHELAKYIPSFVNWLKYIGAIYILWLAFHIAMSKPGSSDGRTIDLMGGFWLALSNVKVILYLITIYTAYIIPASLIEMLLHGIFIILVSAVSWTTWGAVGGLLQKFISAHYKIFNISMGIILAWCAVSIIMN